MKQKLDMALVEVNNNDVKSNKDEGFLSLPYKVPMCVKISFLPVDCLQVQLLMSIFLELPFSRNECIF